MRFLRADDGQGIVEFALILPPILLLLVFGLVELGTVLSESMTLQAATREGARVGSALVNGGGQLGCGPGQSPNAASVDPNIVAAVERVLTGSGTRVTLADVTQIRIFKSNSSGLESGGNVNVWVYALNGGPVVDGQALDFQQTSQPWLPCSRTYASPVDSVGVTVVYTYRAKTPLRMLMPYFNTWTMRDRTVMAMNANR
jgi:hypothetical protein